MGVGGVPLLGYGRSSLQQPSTASLQTNEIDIWFGISVRQNRYGQRGNVYSLCCQCGYNGLLVQMCGKCGRGRGVGGWRVGAPHVRFHLSTTNIE